MTELSKLLLAPCPPRGLLRYFEIFIFVKSNPLIVQFILQPIEYTHSQNAFYGSTYFCFLD